MRLRLWRRANIYVMPRCSAFQVSDDAELQPRGLVAIWFGLMGLSVIVLALLVYRMTIGVDLSDEFVLCNLPGWMAEGWAGPQREPCGAPVGRSAASSGCATLTWFAGTNVV